MNLSEKHAATVWMDRTTPPHVATLVVMAGISALAMNMFLPSLPSMAAYFETEYRVIQLSISGYFAVTAVLQLIIGPLSDRYGRRPVLLVGLGIFVTATLGAMFARTVETFLVFRMIQGGVAVGMVLSRAVVRDMVPPNKAASVIGYVTMGMALVPMLGPMVGGWLEQLFDWRATFLFMFVCGVIVFAVAWKDCGETNLHRSASFLTQFRAYPELIRSRRFWGYSLTAAFTAGTYFSFLGGVAFVSTEYFQLSPAETGFYFIYISAGYMAGNFLTGRFATRYGLNRVMVTGTAISVFGLLIAFAVVVVGINSPHAFFGTIAIVGIGNGLAMPTSNTGIVSVRPHLAGSASGFGAFLMVSGGAVLSATTGTLLTPGSGIYPLVGMMLAAGVASVLAALYVVRIANVAGELGEDAFAE